jgi:hypothetical protein
MTTWNFWKNIGSEVKFDTQAVATLSEKVKRVMTDSQTWMNQSKIILHWLNSTMCNQTIIFTYIRQLEFALIQLEMEIQNLTNGLEFLFHGKLPINLINTNTSYSFLRNVSVLLPEDYSLLDWAMETWVGTTSIQKFWCMQTIIHLE